jgi:hypothetical protein
MPPGERATVVRLRLDRAFVVAAVLAVVGVDGVSHEEVLPGGWTQTSRVRSAT